jgi:hypothetical protein
MSTKSEEDIELLEEGEDYEDGEYEDLDASQAIQDLKDEISIQSELLEQLVDLQQEKLEQDKNFQDRLIAVLEKLANK